MDSTLNTTPSGSLPTPEQNIPGMILPNNPVPVPFNLSDSERLVATLINEIQSLKREVHDIKTDKLVEKLAFPKEMLENMGIVKDEKRTKRGKGFRPILESEINEAQTKCQTASEAARFLNINYYTFRKYAKMYGKWKTNQWYKANGYKINPNKGKYPLNLVLEGKFPNHSVYRIKEKLIESGIKEAECEICGYKERRITDNKLPLLLNFEDGNPKNHKLENIKILCYNCTFCCGKGYIRKGKRYHVMDDPDRVQGANIYVPSRF